MSSILSAISNAAGAAASTIQHGVSSVAKAIAPAPKPTPAPLPPQDTSSVHGTPVTAVSFNVARCADASPTKIANYLKSKNAGVVALQEVSPKEAKALAQQMGMNYTFQGDPTGMDIGMNGKAILSKYPITSSNSEIYSADPLSALGDWLTGKGAENQGPLGAMATGAGVLASNVSSFLSPSSDTAQEPLTPNAFEVRGAQEATINVNGTSVNVFNTHLSNTSNAAVNSEAEQYKSFIDGYSGPKIVMGDLNANPKTSSGIADLASEFTNDLGPQDTATNFLGATPSQTGPGNIEGDHIYTSPDIGVPSSYADAGGGGMSHHHPVVSNLVIPSDEDGDTSQTSPINSILDSIDNFVSFGSGVNAAPPPGPPVDPGPLGQYPSLHGFFDHAE